MKWEVTALQGITDYHLHKRLLSWTKFDLFFMTKESSIGNKSVVCFIIFGEYFFTLTQRFSILFFDSVCNSFVISFVQSLLFHVTFSDMWKDLLIWRNLDETEDFKVTFLLGDIFISLFDFLCNQKCEEKKNQSWCLTVLDCFFLRVRKELFTL